MSTEGLNHSTQPSGPKIEQTPRPTAATSHIHEMHIGATVDTEAADAEKLEEVKSRLDSFSQGENASQRSARSASELKNMDFYERLNLGRDATIEEIKGARKLMFDYHPDQGGDTEAMQFMNEAYDALSDSKKRAAYDARPETTPSSSNTMSTYRGPGFDSLWASVDDALGGMRSRAQEDIVSRLEIEEVKRMIREKIDLLNERDPDEFVTRIGGHYHANRLETTVGQYQSQLEDIFEEFKKGEPISKSDMRDIATQVNGKIKFLGKSKVRQWFRRF